MHLGNGALTPECVLLSWGAAAAGLTCAARAVRREAFDRDRLLATGTLAAAVFAAQMLNVPALPHATAHLVGGLLVCWLLGAASGAWTMAVVLTLQALTLGDGGLAALGANILNMALVPAGVTAVARRLLERRLDWRGDVVLGLATLVSMVLGAGLVALEVAPVTGGAGWAGFAGRMLGIHAWFGLAEGCLTIGLVGLLARQYRTCAGSLDRLGSLSCLIAAFVLVACLLPLASALPDGYEAAARASGLSSVLAEDSTSVRAVGSLNARLLTWQSASVSQWETWFADAQQLAAAATLLCGLLVASFAQLLTWRRA